MSRFLTRSITFLMVLCSMNAAADWTPFEPMWALTSSDYNVTTGDTVTLNYNPGIGPHQYDVTVKFYITKPGSARTLFSSKVWDFSTTVTLDTTGTNLFEAQICYVANGWCSSINGPTEVVASAPPKPGITIYFPSTVTVGVGWDLNVATTNATSCTFRFAAGGSLTSFGTSFTYDDLTYSTPGDYVQTASCTGPGGSTTLDNLITVLPEIASPEPVINSFGNSDVIVGQTKLHWISNYTDRCTLKSGSITDDVPTVSHDYPVTIPVNEDKGLTFTLTCFQESKSVSKELFVPRPSSGDAPCLVRCDWVVNTNGAITKLGKRFADLIGTANVHNPFILEHNVSLKRLGINLLTPELSFNTPDLNADGYPDLIIYQPKLQLAHVLLNNKGSFDAIAATAESLKNRESIKAVYVDEKGQVTLEMMPEVVSTEE